MISGKHDNSSNRPATTADSEAIENRRNMFRSSKCPNRSIHIGAHIPQTGGYRDAGKLLAKILLVSCLGADAQSETFTDDLFRIGCVNCGAFGYGAQRATPETFGREWKRFAQDRMYDAIFYSDTGKGTPGNIAIDGFDITAATACKPSSVSQVRLPNTFETEKGTGTTKRFRALRLVYLIGGRTLAVYGVHLVAEGHIRGARNPQKPSPSQQLRRIQFEALIADARKFDYAILAGDFNAQKPWEYDVFAKAGYKPGNCSSKFGTTATLRNIPADNVILSPGLEFADFAVLKNYTLDTDHFPVAATIKLPPAKRTDTDKKP